MKRKIGRVTFAFAIVLILMLISPMFTSVVYAKDLDKIHTYRITADVQSDGKVKMTYHIDWEVLDSTSEGPLTWVKIGIANKHVEKITGKSKNIKSIKYYNDGGSFIRIDFNKYYYAGFTNWREGEDVLASYACAYAFGAYLVRNFGGIELFHQTLINEYVNEESVTQALKACNQKYVDKNGVEQYADFNYVFENFYKILINNKSANN